MQENVNAVCTNDFAVQNFGAENVSVLPDGVIRCFTKEMGNGDVLTVSNSLQWSDVLIKRSDKGLVIFFSPKPDSKGLDSSYYDADPDDIQAKKIPMVRDFFEALPQEARIAAFDNTAKSKWKNPARDLEEAILTSFYISDSPQGANYWQDVILENK